MGMGRRFGSGRFNSEHLVGRRLVGRRFGGRRFSADRFGDHGVAPIVAQHGVAGLDRQGASREFALARGRCLCGRCRRRTGKWRKRRRHDRMAVLARMRMGRGGLKRRVVGLEAWCRSGLRHDFGRVRLHVDGWQSGRCSVRQNGRGVTRERADMCKLGGSQAERSSAAPRAAAKTDRSGLKARLRCRIGGGGLRRSVLAVWHGLRTGA